LSSESGKIIPNLPLAAAWKLLRRSFTEDVSGCQWSKDKIEDNKLYVQTLQSFILLLRNWSCGSCLAEMKAGHGRQQEESQGCQKEEQFDGSSL